MGKATRRPVFGTGQFALLGIAACLISLVVVWVVASDAPSADRGLTDRLPLPAVDGNAGCANFGRYWTTESGANMDPVVLERFTNCLQNDDGVWSMSRSLFASSAIDPNSLTGEQRTQLDELRGKILDQTGALESVLPKSISDALSKIQSSQTNAVTGDVVEGVSLTSARTRYARVVNAFLLDPEHRELADFVGWTMARKIDAFAQFRRSCLANQEIAYLHDACRGMEDALSIRYAPFPWDLKDPALLETYFNETVVLPSVEQTG